MIIPQAERQLLVSCALAAVNHGLIAQAETIAAAFPELIPNAETRGLCEALLRCGLGQPAAALSCLTRLTSAEAEQLRQLILEAHPGVVSSRAADQQAILQI